MDPRSLLFKLSSYLRAYPPLALTGLLTVSVLLRVILVANGGQNYWPDEARFTRSLVFVSALEQKGGSMGLRRLLKPPRHIGFVLVGVVPLALEQALTSQLGADHRISSLILMLASVGCIVLGYAIARRVGTSRGEALWVAFFMATSASLFYYARHLLPYDTALMLCLAAVWLGVDTRTAVWRSIVCGWVAGFAFLDYNGYWTLALAVGVVHGLFGHLTVNRVKRITAFALGFAALPVLLHLISLELLNPPYLISLMSFAGRITQGDFAEGWQLPFQYLWDTEHLVFVGWLFLAGLGLVVAAQGVTTIHRQDPIPGYVLIWLGVAAGIYLTLAFASTVATRFVVYGRLVRQIIPFLCLAAAWGLVRLLNLPRYRPWALVCLALIVIQVPINFFIPLTQVFPAQVEAWAKTQYPDLGYALTVRTSQKARRIKLPQSRYVLVNAAHLYPILGTTPAPPGFEIIRFRHPLQYAPYQYEGLTAAERRVVNESDIAIRLIDTGTRP